MFLFWELKNTSRDRSKIKKSGFFTDFTFREVIIIMGSLTTCDPGDINKTLEEAVNMKIKCSVINLSAEVGFI